MRDMAALYKALIGLVHVALWLRRRRFSDDVAAPVGARPQAEPGETQEGDVR